MFKPIFEKNLINEILRHSFQGGAHLNIHDDNPQVEMYTFEITATQQTEAEAKWSPFSRRYI